jgi:hypothetical protein
MFRRRARTLIYEELFKFQCIIARRAWEHKGTVPEPSLTDISQQDEETENAATQDAFEASLSPRQKELLARLPFPLTGDQQKVIMEMDADLDRGYRERAALLKNIAEGKIHGTAETGVHHGTPAAGRRRIGKDARCILCLSACNRLERSVRNNGSDGAACTAARRNCSAAAGTARYTGRIPYRKHKGVRTFPAA